MLIAVGILIFLALVFAGIALLSLRQQGKKYLKSFSVGETGHLKQSIEIIRVLPNGDVLVRIDSGLMDWRRYWFMGLDVTNFADGTRIHYLREVTIGPPKEQDFCRLLTITPTRKEEEQK